MAEQIQMLNKIRLSFDEVHVFDDLDLSVKKNKITSIVGPSGCGKTSILNLISEFIAPNSGSLQVEGEKIGYIFQEDRLLPWETVFDNIALVREETDKKEIMELLSILELDGFHDKYPRQLSGGMRQRVAIARAFYYHASLLLMDEPFKSLDYDLRLNLVKYLASLWEKEQNTILFVTHDIDEALLLGHEVIVLSRRPTEILERFSIETKLVDRNINQREHLLIRDKIINHMANSEVTYEKS